jgi:opacity protein-like surface antigen
LASRQDTELIRSSGFFNPETVLLDLEVDYYHVGVLYQWTPGQIHPFVAASVGATVFRPEGSFIDDESRFSFSFGGGVKVMLSDHFGLRFEGRAFSTLVQDDDEFCDDFYCDDEEYLLQGEVRGGLVFAF